MRSRKFEETYNTEVIIGKEKKSSGFYDDDSGEFESVGTLMADIQPYNGGLAEKEYGQVGEVSLRLFCKNTELLDMGAVAKIGEKYYTITYAEHWECGSMGLLRKKASF